MTSQAAPAENRLRLIVMSDLLKAELLGKPIDHARYCAKFPRRRETLSALNNDRLTHQYGGNAIGLTFSGLVLARSPLATKVLTDCRRVYNAMREHFRKHVYEQRASLADLAKTLKPPKPIERAVFAASMLMRDSGANIVTELPVTPDSKVQGNQDLLEKSFTQRVRERRALLNKPRLDVPGWNPPLGYGVHQSSDTGWVFDLLDDIGSTEVKAAWSKCNARGASDPDGAITAARSLVETVCKQVLDDREIAYKPSTDLPNLYRQVRSVLQLDAGQASNRALQMIFQGCTAVVAGLGELRNVAGDSHGKSATSPKPSHRHARLAVALGGAMASFLLTTDDARKLP